MPCESSSTPATAHEPVLHHRSARQRRGLPPARMQLNLTAMIDVIFQLLIYFVITASFAVGEGVLLAKLPKGGSTPAPDLRPPDRPLKIVLTSASMSAVRIALDGTHSVANFSELIQTLDSLQYDPDRGRQGVYKPDNPIIIAPDGQVRWQHVVNAFNAAIAARYRNVSFAPPSPNP